MYIYVYIFKLIYIFNVYIKLIIVLLLIERILVILFYNNLLLLLQNCYVTLTQ